MGVGVLSHVRRQPPPVCGTSGSPWAGRRAGGAGRWLEMRESRARSLCARLPSREPPTSPPPLPLSLSTTPLPQRCPCAATMASSAVAPDSQGVDEAGLVVATGNGKLAREHTSILAFAAHKYWLFVELLPLVALTVVVRIILDNAVPGG
jgi:hypothetical protein